MRSGKRAALAFGLAAAGLVAARHRPRRVRVQGASMGPVLPDGAWVVVARAGRGRVRLGSVVVARHPRDPRLELIKRVVARTLDGGRVWLGGDDPQRSTDSDAFGPVERGQVLAVARLRLLPWPPRWLAADPGAIRPRPGAEPASDLRPWRA